MAAQHSAAMHNTSMTPMGRPLWAAWCALLALTVLWDWSGLDVTVMQQIGGPDGFALRNHWLLEHWLHDRGGEPDQKQQSHQLPVGHAFVGWQRRGGVSLALGCE